MVRLRTRSPTAGVPDWLLTFTPTPEAPTPIDWYRKVRDYCIESDLISEDLDTWISVLSTARRQVTATWGVDATRPDLTTAVRTETDLEPKEAN